MKAIMSINRKTHLYEYLDFIKMAKLDCKSKALLYFYATSYNWTQNQPSWYSQRSICALVSMAPSTYNSIQKKLEDLGWIRTNYRGRDKTVQVWVCVGNSDPDYDNYSWATWHPFNSETEVIADYQHDPFEHRARQQIPDKADPGRQEAVLDYSPEPEEEFEDRAAREAFWQAFEDPHAPLSELPRFERASSNSRYHDLAAELWGV